MKPVAFFKQVKAEAKKIVCPSRREAVVSMISVCVMVFFSSILLFLMDRIIEAAVWRFIVFLEALLG